MITLQQYLSDTQAYLDSLRSEIKATTHVSLPAIVTKFDAQKQTINCVPTIKELIYLNGSVSFKQFPELQEVPIEVPRAGNFAITLPITVGQECRVTFQDLCLDGWWSRGGIQSWNDLRRHDLSDAIATFSPWSQPNVISDYSTNKLEIRSIDNKTKISLADDSINIDRDGKSKIDIDDTGVSITRNNLSNLLINDSSITINQGVNTNILINSSEICLQVGSNALIINSSGIELTTSNLTINGNPYTSHIHSGGTILPDGTTGPIVIVS